MKFCNSCLGHFFLAMADSLVKMVSGPMTLMTAVGGGVIQGPRVEVDSPEGVANLMKFDRAYHHLKMRQELKEMDERRDKLRQKINACQKARAKKH